jgi:hypothetical protein
MEAMVSRISSRLPITCLACAFLASLTGTTNAGGQRGDLATILTEWDKRRERIGSVRYEVTGETIIPAGSTLDPDTNEPYNRPKPAREQKVKSKLTLLLDFQGNRHRLETDCESFNGYEPPDGKVYREVDASLFDDVSLMSKNYWDKKREAVRSATTFCSFLRGLSPLEVDDDFGTRMQAAG